jgi:hypothetical protein
MDLQVVNGLRAKSSARAMTKGGGGGGGGGRAGVSFGRPRDREIGSERRIELRILLRMLSLTTITPSRGGLLTTSNTRDERRGQSLGSGTTSPEAIAVSSCF